MATMMGSMLAAAMALHAAPLLAATPTAGMDEVAREVRDCLAQVRSDPQASIVRAEGLLERADLPAAERVRAFVCAAQGRATVGEAALAEVLAEQAAQLLDTAGLPPAERIKGYAAVAAVQLAIGKAYRAVALMEGASHLARDSNDPGLRLLVLDLLGVIRAAEFEDHAGAEPHFIEAIALAETLGRGAAQRDYNHGLNLVSLGRMDAAEQAFDRALARLEGEGPLGVLHYRVRANRSDVMMARGQVASARTELEQAIAGQLRLHDVQGEVASRTRLAAVLLQEGDAAGAVREADKAVGLAGQGGFAREERAALDVLARALATAGDPARALAVLQRLHAQEVTHLRQQNLRGMVALQAQMQEDSAALANERLRSQAERARLLRNLAFALLALVLAAAAAAIWYQHRIRRRLWRLGALDPLTNLLNRREAGRRLAALGRRRQQTALFLLDVDHFKAVNDQRGHGVGDQVLVELAARLRQARRADDVIARWGGEEFLVACPGLSQAQAEAMAERLRASLQAMRVRPRDGEAFSITVSLGFAPFAFFAGRGEGTWQDAIRLADHALYVAKHAGRNAWAGLWGTAAAEAPRLAVIEADLPHALRAGWVRPCGSSGVRWPAMNPVASVATPGGERRVAPALATLS